jgi:hypothetical protein
MDEKLGSLLVTEEIDDDRLPDAVDALDAAAGEGIGDLGRGGFEGLGLVARPDVGDGLAMDAGVDAIGDGLNLGKLRHAFRLLGSKSDRQAKIGCILSEKGCRL